MVKRLLGMPEDTLQMLEGEVIRNGARHVEPYVVRAGRPDLIGHPRMLEAMSWHRDLLPSYIDRATYRPSRDNWGPLILPPESYFVLGDNRDTSIDSRYWGPIEAWRIRGTVGVIYFSFLRSPTRGWPSIRWERIGKFTS
jgi:signal peptidase I